MTSDASSPRGSQVTNRHCTHCTDKTAWSFEYKNVQEPSFPMTYIAQMLEANKKRNLNCSLKTGIFGNQTPAWFLSLSLAGVHYLFFNSPENPSYINPFYGKLHLSANPERPEIEKRCMIEMIGFSEQRMFASLPSKFIVKWEK